MGSASIAGLIRHHATTRGDRPALTTGDGTATFAVLHARSNQVAGALVAAGVGAQQRVAYLGKNTAAFCELLFGAAKVNAVVVAVNWRLAPAEVAYILDDSEAVVLVVTDELLPVADAAGALTGVKTVVVVGADGPRSYAAWRDASPEVDPGAEPQADDVALQLYTSGTTGLPKGALLTNQNLMAMLPVTARAWWFGPSSVSLVSLPLFHVGGVGWALVGMYVGAHSVLLPEVLIDRVLDVIPRYCVTHAVFVPAVLQTLVAEPAAATADLSSLDVVVYGASPISVDVLTRAMELFDARFVQGYGLTETVGAVIHLLPEDHDPHGPHAHRLRSAGRPMDGVEVRVVDPHSGRDLPTGDVGEVWLRTPRVMKGYWNRPEETAAVLRPDGWFRTGDAGYLDNDGYLYISDRVKDLIISGGENIYPAEVENALMSHSDVADVAVIGVPSDRWGETPKALVVVQPGAGPDARELMEFCRGRLASYKCPTSVEFVDAIPRTATGKIMKRELRAPYWENHDRSVN